MEISAVKLRNSYQINYVDTNNIFVKQSSHCIVETEHGLDIGMILKCQKVLKNPDIIVNGKIVRKLNQQDIEHLPEIESIEDSAFKACREKAKKKKLGMKLISVKCLFDKTKIIFYFVADNRIDFRELVRELAAIFRTRIEMRQIGVRDESRLIGGYGPCGKQLCCTHLIDEFDPVSIKMAKEQNLNLNSMKISGMCGRLLCCLGYEYQCYKEINKNMPHPGTSIKIGDKKYNVVFVDTLKELVHIRDGDRMLPISKADITINGKEYSVDEEILNNYDKIDDSASDDIF